MCFQDGPLMCLYADFNDSVITHITFGIPHWQVPLEFLIASWQIRSLFSKYSLSLLITPCEALIDVGPGHMTCFGTECEEVTVYQFGPSPWRYHMLLFSGTSDLCSEKMLAWPAAPLASGCRAEFTYCRAIPANLQTCSLKLSHTADMQTPEWDITIYCCMSLWLGDCYTAINNGYMHEFHLLIF